MGHRLVPTRSSDASARHSSGPFGGCLGTVSAPLSPQSYNDWKNYALSGSTYDPSEDEEASAEAIANFSSELGPDPRLVQNLDPRLLKRATELLEPLLLSSSAPQPSAEQLRRSPLEKFRPVVEMGIAESADAAHDVFRVQFEPQAADAMTVEDAKRVVRGVLRSLDRTAARLSEFAAKKPESLAAQLERRARRAAARVDYEALLSRKEAALQKAQSVVEDAQRKIAEAQRVVEDARRDFQASNESIESSKSTKSNESTKSIEPNESQLSAAANLRVAEASLRSAQKRLAHALRTQTEVKRSLERVRAEASGDRIALSRVLSAAIQSADVSDLASKTAASVSQSGAATRAEKTAATQEAARASERTAQLSLRAAKLAAKLASC